VHALSRPSIVPTTLTVRSSARPCSIPGRDAGGQTPLPSSQVRTAAPTHVPMAEEQRRTDALVLLRYVDATLPVQETNARVGDEADALFPRARSFQASRPFGRTAFAKVTRRRVVHKSAVAKPIDERAKFGRLLGTSTASFSHVATDRTTMFRRQLGQHQVSTLSGPSSSTILCLPSTSLSKFVVPTAVRLKRALSFI
jgi:hypothetical protein